jgi:hypothetical protein
MSTRTVETIAQELEAARTRLAELKADHERHSQRAAELKEQGVGLLTDGKRSEAKRLREARFESEDEAAAALTLAERAERAIRELEAEHRQAIESEAREKLEAADAAALQVEESLRRAVEGLARTAERHREAKALRDQHSRSLGIPVASMDRTAWLVFAWLVHSGAVDSRDIAIPRDALMRFIEPQAVAHRKATADQAMRQEFERTRADYLRDELLLIRKKVKACGTSKAKAEVARRANLVAQAEFIERQLKTLENPEPEPAAELEVVSA